MKTPIFPLSAIILSLVLTSCGGGGGSSPSGVTVDGFYSDAPVDKATCILYKADGTQIAKPTISKRGAFQFNNVSQTGTVYIECEGGSYVDDATGNTVDLTGTRMRSVKDLSGERNAVAVITPLTEISFQLANEDGDLSDFSDHLTDVADEFGLDGINLSEVLPTPIESISGNISETDRYSAVLVAISQIGNNLNVDTQTFIQQTVIDLSDGILDTTRLEQALVDITVNPNTSATISDTSTITSIIGETDGNNADHTPVFTSAENISTNEKTTITGYTATASDADGHEVTFSLTGGADQAWFSIDTASGVLSFRAPSDFEIPTDSDANNTYMVEITATDGANAVSQVVTVTVVDVGGTVTGLTGMGLVLQLNGANDLAVAGNDFEFNAPLTTGDSYEVSVLSNPSGGSCVVENASGVVGVNNISDVSIACISWNSPEKLSSGTADTSYVDADSDQAGNVVAVWRVFDGSNADIWTNQYLVGSGWGTAQRIESTPELSGFPNIAINDFGDAVVIWRQHDGTRYNLWINRYTVGGTWGVPELVETSAGDVETFGDVAISSNGDFLVTWSQRDSNLILNAHARAFVNGVGWENEVKLGDISVVKDAEYDSSGNAIVVWMQHDGTRYNIAASRYTGNSTWSASEVIETSNNRADDPRIAFDSNDNAMVVWQEGPQLWSNKYQTGVAWGVAQLVHESGTGSIAAYPKLSVEPNGDAFAVWKEINGSQYDIWAAKYVAGTGWEKAQQIDTNLASSNVPNITSDGLGNAHAIWESRNNINEYDIYVTKYLAGNGWYTELLIGSGAYTYGSRRLQIITGVNGGTMAIWAQSNGVYSSVSQ